MRKLFKTLAVITCVFAAVLASKAGMIKITHTDVSNKSTTETNDAAGRGAFINGFVEGVFLDFTGSSSFTATVSVVTGGGSGAPPSRTILSKSAILADTYFPVRLIPTKTTGVAITANEDARIPLVQDTIEVTVSGVSTQDVDTLDLSTYIYIR